jgi:predicted branched-subunit amino acid permease
MTALQSDRIPRAARADLIAGVRGMVPWLLAVTPFGLVIGISAAKANLPTLAGWLTGPLIYAGSSQVAAIELLHAGAAPLVVVVTALVINLRLVLYSAAVAPYWRQTPWWWRLLASYLLVDPSFVVGIERYARDGARRSAHIYYLGGAVALWVTWLAAITVGALAGAKLPAGLGLELLIPLFLVGQVVPKLAGTATRRAVIAAVAVALLAQSAPMHLGVALAILAGIGAGLTRSSKGAH